MRKPKMHLVLMKKIIQKLMKEKLKINCYFLIKGQGVKLILKADILLNCPVRYLLIVKPQKQK